MKQAGKAACSFSDPSGSRSVGGCSSKHSERSNTCSAWAPRAASRCRTQPKMHPNPKGFENHSWVLGFESKGRHPPTSSGTAGCPGALAAGNPSLPPPQRGEPGGTGIWHEEQHYHRATEKALQGHQQRVRYLKLGTRKRKRLQTGRSDLRQALQAASATKFSGIRRMSEVWLFFLLSLHQLL